jgi:hypothetical protein
MTVLNEDDCRLLTKAMDHAWELYLKSRRLTAQNLHLAQGAIAYALIEVAQRGERNARMLAKTALERVTEHEARLQELRVLRRD